MPGTTTKYALPYTLGADVGSTIDDTMQALAQAVETLVDQILPVGTLAATARATAPTGWALCEGQIVAQAGTYAALFAAIGTVYNTGGEGAGNFRLPDFRGRVLVGVDGAAGRLDASDALGNAGGTQKHALTSAELAAHTHADGTLAAAAHQHSQGDLRTVTNSIAYMSGAVGTQWYGAQPNQAPHLRNDVQHNITGNTGLAGADVTGNTGSTGSGTAHNNMPPYQVVNWMVKI